MDKPHVAALKRAIEIAGSQAALAEGIAKFLKRSFTQQAVSKWLVNEALVEAEYWAAFLHVTDGEIGGPQLRPDVFADAKLPTRSSSAARA